MDFDIAQPSCLETNFAIRTFERNTSSVCAWGHRLDRGFAATDDRQAVSMWIPYGPIELNNSGMSAISVKAIQAHDHQALGAMLAKYTDNAIGFDKLRPGITLELERKGLGKRICVGVGRYQDSVGKMQSLFDVYDSDDVENGSGQQYPGDITFGGEAN